ncbi:MAG: FHA domain-containing protein [Chamaesiphon sp.]|nr:FHA domain-containing protein [Chamaesiphon sp.]
MKIKVCRAETLTELTEFDLAAKIRNRGECIVGRSPEVGLVLDSEDVSRQHGKFFLQDGHYYFSDLGSSNGSVINDRVVDRNQPCILKNGDAIHIGDFVLLMEEQPQEVAQTVFKVIDPWMFKPKPAELEVPTSGAEVLLSSEAPDAVMSNLEVVNTESSTLHDGVIEEVLLLEVPSFNPSTDTIIQVGVTDAATADVNVVPAAESEYFATIAAVIPPIDEFTLADSIAAPLTEGEPDLPIGLVANPTETSGGLAAVEPIDEFAEEGEQISLFDPVDQPSQSEPDLPIGLVANPTETPAVLSIVDMSDEDEAISLVDSVEPIPTIETDLPVELISDASTFSPEAIAEIESFEADKDEEISLVDSAEPTPAIETDLSVEPISDVREPLLAVNHEEISLLESEEPTVEGEPVPSIAVGADGSEATDRVSDTVEPIEQLLDPDEEISLFEPEEPMPTISNIEQIAVASTVGGAAYLSTKIEELMPSNEISSLTESANSLAEPLEPSITTSLLNDKQVVAIAHDTMMPDLIDFIELHKNFFAKCLLVSWSADSQELQQQTGLSLSQELPSGAAGGYQKIAASVNSGDVAAVIFLRDFLQPQSGQANEEALLRLCNINQILLATNVATAAAIVSHLS